MSEKYIEKADKIHQKMNQIRGLINEIHEDLRAMAIQMNEDGYYKEESLVWISGRILESSQESLRLVETGINYALEDEQ